MTPAENVVKAVPFFGVRDIEASLRFYRDGLGFGIKHQWIPEGKLRWCWIELGPVAVMLQEYLPEHLPATKLGVGVSTTFTCKDAIALYRHFKSQGLDPKRPFVGNQMWVTQLTDPDGYELFFESPTDAPEESVYEE